MTQALLNNLNITKDSSFSLKDSSVKTAVSDFEKILNTKTKSEKSAKDENSTEITTERYSECSKENAKQQISEQTQKQEVVNENVKENAKTLGDIKNQTPKEVLTEEINTTILENAAESIIDMIIEENDASETEEETSSQDNKASKENSTEDDKSGENTEENNITDEDSTMQKEINAPENPTTVLLLSQIQTNVKIPANDKAETTEQEINYTFTNDSSAERDVPKEFENMLTSKEILSISNGTKDTFTAKTEQSKQNTVLNEKTVKELNIESVNSESASNSSSGDLMQNQSPQEQTVKIMLQGDIKAEAKTEIVKTVDVKPITITPEKIIEQISKQLEGMYNNSKLSMVLNPGTLGKLHLHLMNGKDGLVAQFTVTTQEAKDILLKGLNGLKDALFAQGISVDNVSVKLEDTKNEEGFDWTEQEGSRGGNKQQGARKQKDDEKPFEQMMFEMENNDNLV